VKDLLIRKYGAKEDNIVLLTDEKVSSDNLVTSMKSTYGKLHKGDQFVFFFSGHGTRITDKESKDSDGKALRLYCKTSH